MKNVQGFYDAHADYEWQRLERHRMEFSMNMRMLREYLPATPAAILDVGGGPGRYAISLSQLGYSVTLLDLSANCLAFARTKAAEAGVSLVETIHGNALDLGALPADSCDAVLLMGPMYHLQAEADRIQALREARRVLKPGCLLFVAFITRYASLRVSQADWVVANLSRVQEEVATGIHIDDGRFTDAYLAHPAEVRPLLEEGGFTCVEMLASEGLRSDIDGPVNHLTGALWDAWIDLHYRVGKDPAVHGASVHLLAVGRK